MSNQLTAAIMGDPSATRRRTAEPEPVAPEPKPERTVRWWKPGVGNLTVTVNAKGELLLSKMLQTAMFGETAAGERYVRIGNLDTGDIIIERTDAKHPVARKVFVTNGLIGGGSVQSELAAHGFAVGRYKATLNQQSTIAVVKKP